MGTPQTFHKSERLTQHGLIRAIFQKKGKTLRSGPLLLVYLEHPLHTSYPAQVLISVPKKRFSKAHERNRVKRLLREVYRMNKEAIYEKIRSKDTQFALALIYLGNEQPDIVPLEQHFKKIVNDFVAMD